MKHLTLTVEEPAFSVPSTTIALTLRINGADRMLAVEPRVSLLDALREHLGLTGAKKGCNQGACGACTVLCNGQRVLSCLSLAVQYEGAEITTIEGLSTGDRLHPLQAAFIEQDGFQCGYCTPGQICSAIGMIEEFRSGLPSAVTADVGADAIELSAEELNERMSGNLCRCGAYIGIRAAIRQAFGSGSAMNNFTYSRAKTSEEALSLIATLPQAKFLGGGTNLVDLMRENIEQPEALIDVSGLTSAAGISEADGGGVSIGAEVKNTAVANHPLIRSRYPLLSQAILFGASGQIRNMATVGGNIMQRTRCYYFYDQASKCNKRMPGAGCDAIDGFNRIHAILGTSEHCIATHPSDMCVALAALDATIRVNGPEGERSIPFNDFHCLPGDTPHIETVLRPKELITSVELPALPWGKRSTYRKVRDRASYAFALVSVAAVLEINEGKISNVRVALGGVAPKPWRAHEAEGLLMGADASVETFRRAAEAELSHAVGFRDNAFKIELAKRTIAGVLNELAAAGDRQ